MREDRGARPEPFEREQAEHHAKLAACEARIKQTERKPGGTPPQWPTAGAMPNDRINLTDEKSRIMPVAGGLPGADKDETELVGRDHRFQLRIRAKVESSRTSATCFPWTRWRSGNDA